MQTQIPAFRSALLGAACFVVLTATEARAQRPAPIPRSVRALDGCWRGTGEAVGKHVQVQLKAQPILDQAMLTVDAQSSTIGRPEDRYSAHLVFGGASQADAASKIDVMGFWSDTFGGAYAVMGRGQSSSNGFEVAYTYPSDTFVNRWSLMHDDLRWVIVERDPSGVEKPFASYSLGRTRCR